MGLIKAGIDATLSTFHDVWKDYFVSNSLDNDVLMVKGEKRTNKRSFFSKNGEENVITNGSGIVVAEGQCMIIVQDGVILELASEPGLYTYDIDMAPSFFGENLTDGVASIFSEISSRFAFGGIRNRDERVYFFNMKEIVSNKYGTANPIPFRVIDRNIGLDIDISVRCNGEYSFKIINPILFYTNVGGNIDREYKKSELESQMRAEFLTALQPALAKVGMSGVRYSEVPFHLEELCSALNEILSDKWAELRGIEIVSVGMNSITAPKEDEDMIKSLQKSSVFRDPRLAAANLSAAQADAMRMAASNENGAIMGFMGLNQAMGAGMNISDLYNMKEEAPVNQINSWKCSCGNTNTGNFCSRCGSKKPSLQFCSKCGNKVNTGEVFCSNCGERIG